MTATEQAQPAPPRGTRPTNRRALIIAAAARLFHDLGYPNVGMGDIADAVNVRPSALYRHFSGKDELFAAAAHAALEPVRAAVAEPGEFDALVRALAAAAIGQRAIGVLWQREARHLPDEARKRLRAELSGTAHLLAERIGRRRPELDAAQADLLSWSALSALGSISFHRIQLPAARLQELMHEILHRIVHAPIPGLGAAAPRPRGRGLALHSRREQILAEAARLFADNGSSSVTIDDIGEAVGIAGPSIYTSFASKQEILTAALNRGNEWLWTEASRALAAAADEQDALERMLRAYLGLAGERGEYIAVLIIDRDQLPEAEQHRIRRAQHEFITEWVELLRAVQPGLGADPARIQVQAALMIVNDLTRTPHLRDLSGFEDAVFAVARCLLGP